MTDYTEIKIRRIRIITTDREIFSAWAPTTCLGGGFSTITTFDDAKGRWWGRIGTDRLPPEVDAIAPEPERIAAVRAFHAARYAAAYEAIQAEYPRLRSGAARFDMGEIEAYVGAEG